MKVEVSLQTQQSPSTISKKAYQLQREAIQLAFDQVFELDELLKVLVNGISNICFPRLFW